MNLKQRFPYLIPLVPFFLGFIFRQRLCLKIVSFLEILMVRLMCDGFPNNCCKDMMAVTYPQIIFWLGIGLSVAPFVILWKKESQKQSDVELKIV